MGRVHHAGLLAVAAFAVLPRGCCGAGGAKLWELGLDVEDNPLTVFIMFAFTVLMTILLETTKHNVEHKITDPHLKKGLQVIYGELMMVGVVSFLLILSGELGVLDIRIKIGCDDEEPVMAPVPSASQSVSDSGSGSGSASTCGYGFDLLMFEYAHLVLFFMGITYSVFILQAFWQRDRMCREIAELQKQTLAGYYQEKPSPASVLGTMGVWFTRSGWARTILTLRGAMCWHLHDEMQRAAHPEVAMTEVWLAKYRGEPLPARIPHPDEVHMRFDMARFTKLATSEVLTDLIHVPPVVWGAIVLMAAMNLIHKAGLTLADAMLITLIFGPLLALILLWRLSEQLVQVVRRAAGNTAIFEYEYFRADGPRAPRGHNMGLSGKVAQPGIDWKKGGEDPWVVLTGMCNDDSMFNFMDPLDPDALERQIQIVVFASCFYIGEVIMLSNLIIDEVGVGLFLICAFLPWPPLLLWIPRAIMVFSLVYRSKAPPIHWLLYAVKEEDDPVPHPRNPDDDDDCDSDGEPYEHKVAEPTFKRETKGKSAVVISPAETADSGVEYQPDYDFPYYAHDASPLAYSPALPVSEQIPFSVGTSRGHRFHPLNS